jgi:hypothetical protein
MPRALLFHRLRSRRLWLRALLAAAPVGVATGCANGLPQCKALGADYLLVEYRAGGDFNTAPKVEVNETPGYKTRHTSLRSAAIRAPNECSNQTAAQASGLAPATDTILKTTCGVYLKEFESALAKAGFRVFSWDAVQQLERTRGSTYEAAKSLGADVVFIFNSAEVPEIRAGAASAARARYFHSNERGEPGEPFVSAADDPVRAYMHDFVKGHMPSTDAANAPPVALACTVDVTAVWVAGDAPAAAPVPAPVAGAAPSPAPGAAPAPPAPAQASAAQGESIWFYRRTETKPLKQSDGRRFLFAGLEGQYAPVRPVGLAEPDKPQTAYSSEDVEAMARDVAEKDPYQRDKLDLIRIAATDFVERFMHGGGS